MNMILSTQSRQFLKNNKERGQNDEGFKKAKRFTNPENEDGLKGRSFTKVEQDESYVFGKEEDEQIEQPLENEIQSLLNEIFEGEQYDERSQLEKQGLIDYDHNDLREIQAENQQKVNNYLDSLNYHQRQYLLRFYNQNKTQEQSFLDYKDQFQEIFQKIENLSPKKSQILEKNQKIAQYFEELPKEGQILLSQLVENLNQEENNGLKDLESLLDLSLSWQKLKEADTDDKFQSVLQSTLDSKNWKLENLDKIVNRDFYIQKQIDEEAEQKLEKQKKKSSQKAKIEVEEHLLNSGESYLILNSKLKASLVSGSQNIAPSLQSLKNEVDLIQKESEANSLFLESTPQGNSIMKFKEMIYAFRNKTRDNWTPNQVNRFVISYLQIFKEFKISKYNSTHFNTQQQEAFHNDLQNLELILSKFMQSIQLQESESLAVEQIKLQQKQNQSFVQNVRRLVTLNIDQQVLKKDKKLVFDVLDQCLLQKGFLPQLEIQKDQTDIQNLIEFQEKQNELKYQEYMRKVLYEDLKLQKDAQFWTFIADIVLNTAQTNKFIKETSVQDEILKELGMEDNYGKSYPLVDRFVNLLLSLYDPTFYKNFTHANNNYLKELGITYNLKNKDAAVGYNVIQNPEYMLKYQLVSLAKFHNFYGSVDQYMKEFTKICIATGNQTIIKNLQNLLNSEVSIYNEQSAEPLLKNYKSLPREIDPMLLAQPEFQFSPVSDKIKMIQNYLDLVKEQDRTREAILLLEKSTSDPLIFRQLTNNFDTINKLLEEIDSDQSNYDLRIGKTIGTFEKFKKTSVFIDENIRSSFLSLYGIDGIGFNNLEDVYQPLVSGFGQLQDTRSYLLKKGMTVQFADLLAAKYIRKLEDPKNSKIFTIMDFFDTKRDSFQAMKFLADANIKNVFLNYSTLNAYSRQINNAEMIKAMSSTFKMPQSTKFAISKNPKSQPIRPISPIFSQSSITQKKQQIFAGAGLRAFSDNQGERGRFFDFLKIAEEVDEKVKIQKEQEQEDKNKIETLQETQYDFQNIDVSFQSNPQNRLQSEFNAEQMNEFADQDHSGIFENQEMEEKNERQQLIQNAINKYDLQFFMQFTFTGKDFLKFSQKNLEEFIVKLESQEDVNLLLLSAINQSYELNQQIPNIEFLIFKIFCSPISTRDIRKAQEDQNILAGNIFAQKNIKLDQDIYLSLLHTLKMKPKKKHFKKVVAYIRKFTEPKDISPKFIDLFVNLGIEMQIPETLGKLVRDMIVQDDCKIQKSTFLKFLAFMERSKGYEEDAKKFLTLVTQESSSLQIDYEMCRPIILRMMKYKGGPEVIKFFEQLRKNIKLNKANSLLPQIEKNKLLKDIRKGFFIGLMKDFMENKNYQLAEIVMTELQKEKFDVTLEDELIALNIYAAQKKITDYKQKFNLFFSESKESGFELTQKITVELSKTLTEFYSDEFKNDRLMLAEKLNRKMQQNLLVYEGEVLHNIIYIYAESQLWIEVANVLKAQQNPQLCFPLPKTLNYLKQNLVYIFQTTQRQAIQEALETFEQTFFSYKLKQERSSQKQQLLNDKQEKRKMDDILGEDLKEQGDKDKKLMRRQARQQSKPVEDNEGKAKDQEAKKENEKDIKEKQ